MTIFNMKLIRCLFNTTLAGPRIFICHLKRNGLTKISLFQVHLVFAKFSKPPHGRPGFFVIHLICVCSHMTDRHVIDATNVTNGRKSG